MKRVLALAALLVLAPAGGAASVRSVTAPAPVLALELDSSFIAYAVGRSRTGLQQGLRLEPREAGRHEARSQDELRADEHRELDRRRLRRRQASALGALRRRQHPRVVALDRDDDEAFAAPAAFRQPRRRRTRADRDRPGRLVELGDLLPYAVDRTVVALRVDGSRRFAWTAPARVVALSALDGELAVATEGATVTILDAGGRVLRTETYDSGAQGRPPHGQRRPRPSRQPARAERRLRQPELANPRISPAGGRERHAGALLLRRRDPIPAVHALHRPARSRWRRWHGSTGRGS